ncbi:MAG: bifunctional phosphoribosyl-AMP cyclohydrolase/phosphoribosyl-ATP diphosphatase HisIE [Bacillota bacterium]|nr:bifunctional phosphoribosyl-AMP cyclohydrolase/phosphoribosyl-ATP diphosphatase HisIE [Bacillota bacterium]
MTWTPTSSPSQTPSSAPSPAPSPPPALVPVIVQDAGDNTVLMLAYADPEALARAIGTGQGWYYSRSRGRLWRKGETSGNTQSVVGAWLDCDADAVLLRVKQSGPACHTGARSCFFRPLGPAELADVCFQGPGDLEFLGTLERLIQDRARARPAGSYVSGLLGAGLSRVLQKVGEETVEFILAAAAAGAPGGASEKTARQVREEAADVLFHLIVAFEAAGLGLGEIAALLRARHDERAKKADPARETSHCPQT